MRFEVRFVLPLTEQSPIRFLGTGAIHLLETAMVCEGPCSTTFVPLVSGAVRSITSRWTVYTLPYLTIKKLEPPEMPFKWSHHIVFECMDGSHKAIGFRFRGWKSVQADIFRARLSELRNAYEKGMDNG